MFILIFDGVVMVIFSKKINISKYKCMNILLTLPKGKINNAYLSKQRG